MNVGSASTNSPNANVQFRKSVIAAYGWTDSDSSGINFPPVLPDGGNPASASAAPAASAASATESSARGREIGKWCIGVFMTPILGVSVTPCQGYWLPLRPIRALRLHCLLPHPDARPPAPDLAHLLHLAHHRPRHLFWLFKITQPTRTRGKLRSCSVAAFSLPWPPSR